jgi:hypothetical protein
MKVAYVLRPGQGPLKLLGPGALYRCLEKSIPLPATEPEAPTMRTEGVKTAVRRMRDLKSSLNIFELLVSLKEFPETSQWLEDGAL